MGKGKKQIVQNSNFGALIAAVQEQNTLAGEQMDLTIASNFILTNISNNIADMTNAVIAMGDSSLLANNIGDMSKAIESMRDNMLSEHMKSLEKEREDKAYKDKMLEALGKLVPPKKEKPQESGGGWGLVGAILAGVVAGVAEFVTQYVLALKKAWTALTKALKLDGILGSIVEKIKGTFTFIEELFSGWGKKLLSVLDDLVGNTKGGGIMRTFKVGILNVFEKLGSLFGFSGKGLFKDFATLFDSIKDMWNLVMEPIKKMFSGGKGMFSFVDDILKGLSFFKPIMTFFKSIGNILGKLAWPIQVIMSIWDTVSGMIDGWNKTEGSMWDKAWGAIAGGLKGLVNGLVGSLLDLIKNGVSWIASFFGAKDFAAWLDSFSFEDIIGKFIDKVIGFIKGMWEWIGELFTNPGKAMADLGGAIADMATMASDLIKSILKAVLPRKDPSGNWYDPNNLAAKAIPDAVYKFAGIDPGTGQDLPEAPKADASKVTGQKGQDVSSVQAGLNNAQSENQTAKAESDKATQGLLATTAANSSKPSTVVAGGGGGGGVVPLSSKATNWDPEDAMARGVVMA